MKRAKAISLLLLLLAMLFLVPAPGATAAPSQVAPTSLVVITPESVTALVDQFVAQKMEAAHAPGLAVTVVYRDEVMLAKGYGLADLATGRAMTAQTPLRAGSVSKPVTSAAVLQLVAQGRIALDERLSAYLPNLPLADEYGPSGTIAQSLTLQGGYSDKVVLTHAPTLATWQPLGAYLAEGLPARVLPPGKVYSYNSWDHALLGQTMAAVTGEPFDRAIDETLLRPLGMSQTTFTQPLPDPIAAMLATGYAYDGSSYQTVPLDYVNLSPGIGMVTTAADMGRFMRALLNEGVLDGAQVLAPATVAGMLQRQEEVHPYSRARTYGFSEVTLGERQVLYQDGNGIGEANRMILAPEMGLGVFVSTNHRPLAGDISSTPANEFIKELGTFLLERYVPAASATMSRLPAVPDAAARAVRYAGHYRFAGTPQDDFFKLNALLDNVDVTDNGDGTISIGSGRYREVEPLLFQSESDPSFFVVFVENDAGDVSWLTFGGTEAYAKAPWYETVTFQMVLVGSVLLLSLIFLVAMPFSAHRHWSVWVMSLLHVVFLAGLALLMTQADLVLYFKTIPAGTKLLFMVPWLVAALALTLPPVLVTLWRKRATRRARLLYTLSTVATAAFLWFATYWHLIWV